MNAYRNKVAIITGAGSGIGRELAMQIARRGGVVVGCDINQENITAARDAINNTCAGSMTALTVDVTDYDAVKETVDGAVASHGHIDYMFNNAGIGIGGEARDIAIEDWRAVLDVNLYGVVNGVAAAYPVMVEQGFGHIVNTSSFSGLVPLPGHVSYTTSKYAVIGLSHSLRMEAAPLGVKVSVVCPGRVETPVFESAKMVNYDREKAMKIVNSAPGMSTEECVRHILRGVARNEETIIPSGYVKHLWRLERAGPLLLHRIITRAIGIMPGPRKED